MNINPNELDRFRKDFKDAVAPLQDKYDITILFTGGDSVYDPTLIDCLYENAGLVT